MRKFLWLLLVLLLTACARNTIPPASPASGSAGLVPQVWQRGTPPVHWVFFPVPSPDQLENIYTWPLADGANVVYGTVCCEPGGAPPNGGWGGINISGSPATITNFNPSNQVINSANPQTIPIKIVPCANATQICSRSRDFVYGPNNVAYFANNQFIEDLTAGSGNSMWFNTCCSGSYIVYGNNGSLHFYRIPNTKDHLGDIARTSDGNIWVTLQHVGTTPWILAKLTPSTSVVTEYPLQLPSDPQQLLVGPDGNIWFAIASTLYRLVPSSAQVTRFALPQSSNGYLAIGPNKTVWTGYVNSAAAQGLIEASTAGTVLGSFACPVNFCVSDALNDRVQQLTEGPDGNIWFAYSNTQMFNDNPPSDPSEGFGVFVVQPMSVSPSSVTFSGTAQTKTISFSEPNYAGTFTAASTNTSIVRVVKFLTPHEVEIQSVAKGSARIIIRDTTNNYYGLTVTVE